MHYVMHYTVAGTTAVGLCSYSTYGYNRGWQTIEAFNRKGLPLCLQGADADQLPLGGGGGWAIFNLLQNLWNLDGWTMVFGKNYENCLFSLNFDIL